MATTSHFGLQKYAGPPESPADNNYAASSSNFDTIDDQLYLHATHHHTGDVAPVAAPAAAPTISLSSFPGTFAAGTTYYYQYTWVTPNGLESLPSPLGSYVTPAAVVEPDAPTLSTATTGGELAAGDYYYVLTAFKPDTNYETLAINAAHINIPVGTSTNTVTVTFPELPAGGCGFNVYRKAPNGIGYFLAATIPTAATPPSSWVDDGSECTCCDRTLPVANLTTYQASLYVCIGGATPALPPSYKWRLYRSPIPDNFFASLVATIDTGVCIIDTGAPTHVGSPPTEASSLNAPSRVLLTDETEVQGVLPPANIVYRDVIQFAEAGTLTGTKTGTFAWHCPYEKAQIQYVVASLGRGSTPAATSVIVDVVKYDANAATPTWASMWSDNTMLMPTIAVGQHLSAQTVPTLTTSLLKNDLLTVDIKQIGGGATPTDANLLVQIVIYYQDTTATTVVFA